MTRALTLLLVAVNCTGLPMCAIAAPPSALDAPIKPSTPTVGSEIKRGSDAVFQCGMIYVSPLEVQAFARCVGDQELTNRNEMKSGYEAFNTGLYFAARKYAQISLNVLTDHGEPAAGVDSIIERFDIGLRNSSQKFGLTDEQLRIATFGK